MSTEMFRLLKLSQSLPTFKYLFVGKSEDYHVVINFCFDPLVASPEAYLFGPETAESIDRGTGCTIDSMEKFAKKVREKFENGDYDDVMISEFGKIEKLKN